MCIAQEILENYFELKQTLMKARKEYLKKKVKKEKEEQYLLNMQAPKFRVNNSETILARKHLGTPVSISGSITIGTIFMYLYLYLAHGFDPIITINYSIELISWVILLYFGLKEKNG